MGHNMELLDYIEATNRSENTTQAVDLYQKALADIGFDRMMYSAVQAHEATSQVCLASTYPMDWIEYYMNNGYMDLDPLRRYGHLQRSTFSWDSLSERYKFSRIERKVMSEARDASLFDGAAVPLHGPGGEVVGASVASSSPHPDSKRFLNQLNLITVQFHTVYTALCAEAVAAPTPSLSNREREVLQWAARGKSNWVIGELLNISDHGVDYHFRNILRKLEADSRITAVVKGLYLGLISL
jgi:DNA-binding CsgD family transcriptional regulator